MQKTVDRIENQSKDLRDRIEALKRKIKQTRQYASSVSNCALSAMLFIDIHVIFLYQNSELIYFHKTGIFRLARFQLLDNFVNFVDLRIEDKHTSILETLW